MLGRMLPVVVFQKTDRLVQEKIFDLYQWSEVQKKTSSHLNGHDSTNCFQKIPKMLQLSNEKRVPGRLGYIGDYTLKLYTDYNKPM